MKMKYFVILLLFFTTQFSYGQSDTPLLTKSELDTLLNKNYEGGSKIFYKKLYSSLRYPPKARLNCAIGTTDAIFSIDENGDIVDFSLSRKLGHGIENAIEIAVNATADGWKKEMPANVSLLIGFEVGVNKDVKADIMISAVAMDRATGKPKDMGCKSNAEILEKALKYIKKKKYKKAKKQINLLLGRDPNSTHFNSLHKLVEGKLSER